MDESLIEALITPKTKAIVVVHYAGVACDMDTIMNIANKHSIFVVEDAAQAIDSSYKGKPLGSIGHLGCFSFHETKNLQCGEGGMLCINDEQFIRRAEILWEKGTNRAEFFRGEINKYGWVDTGSSFLPSDVLAAFLYAQLQSIEKIQKRRKEIWDLYYNGIHHTDSISLPFLPEYATNNSHMFYLICSSLEVRTSLINKLKQHNYSAVFHYQSLHNSDFYKEKHDMRELPFSDIYTDCLVRLPLFFELENDSIKEIIAICNS
jgi:dTDP-4-amino-4,6-dideoxygalactose transaminase